MRVHHLNGISMCPVGGRLLNGRGCDDGVGTLACHCLLVETEQGLLLVDTGFGLNDVDHPEPRLSPFFLKMLRPQLHATGTLVRQIEHLGFGAEDVRHIVLTHLDFDHAGGLDDFPLAKVHLLEAEKQTAMALEGRLDRQRYRPRQWTSQTRWVSYPETGESWFGFQAVRELEGLPPEVLLVPLAGHTLGHAGVAVDVGSRWLLHAGDAYFFHAELHPSRPHCPPALRAFEWLMEKDRDQRLQNQARLRALKRAHGAQVRVFCSHDPVELEECWAQAPVRVPGGLEASPALRP